MNILKAEFETDRSQITNASLTPAVLFDFFHVVSCCNVTRLIIVVFLTSSC